MPIIQPTPIDQLPQPPNPADRSNFNSLAYPFTAAMLPMTEQINKAISDTYNNALEAETRAGEADASATAAANSVIDADTAKTGAETAMAGAENARSDAQSSATAAANSATAANTAKVGAEAARDAAAQSATDAAQSAQDAADIAQGEFGPAIHAATAKGTPADDDEFAVTDSQASWSLKKLTWSNLKAAIWAAFKTIATGENAKDTLGLGTAATRNVGESAGNVMQVGVFGIGNNGAAGRVRPTNIRGVTHSGMYQLAGGAGADYPPVGAASTLLQLNWESNTEVKTQIVHGLNNRVFVGARDGTGWFPYRELIHTGNIQSTTGQSTEFPMTQKAVTDALTNAGSLASSSATYEYDALGRVEKITTPNGDTLIGYDLDGRVETITYPTGRVETFTYDASGSVTAMTATGG